jgi:hypothetical protein
MYIDSLTLTAILILVVAIGLVIHYCICNLCGGPDPRDPVDRPTE